MVIILIADLSMVSRWAEWMVDWTDIPMSW